jgi:glutamate/tyrosine decarboxylase-like PLP-dependent enzyme
MFSSKKQIEEISLDPADWLSMKKLGHRMVDDMIDYLQTVRERPVWKPIPDNVKKHFKKPIPTEPQSESQIYQEFLDHILPNPMGNIHPRFWGWVIGTGTVFGMLAEMLAAGFNPNLGGADHIANYVEAQVIDWCKEMLHYSQNASGLLVSGGSMANLVGLTVARNTKSEFDIRKLGVEASPQKLTLYGSSEMHSSIQKAVELLGLGSESLRKIPVDSNFRIRISDLEKSISEDRKKGYKPICIIGNAGTVNTGAIDDLTTIADLCKKENLWFHIDGAFGALIALSPELRHLVKGMDRADSIAFDLHKWMYMPLEIGCVLVKNEKDHRKAFSLTPEYLVHGGKRGLAAGSNWPSDYGVQLSRGFRALKAWMSIKEHGIRKYGQLIHQNVEQARYFARLVEQSPELELLAPVSLNIVCFRFRKYNLTDDILNELNKEIMIRLHESGIAVPSYTTLGNIFALRIAVTNHRSRKEDFEIFVKEVIKQGKELTKTRQ